MYDIYTKRLPIVVLLLARKLGDFFFSGNDTVEL